MHCTASSNPSHDDARIIDKWHRDRGWNGIGYHYFIKRNGELQIGRDVDLTPAAQAPYNHNTIAIVMHGGEEISRNPYKYADDFTAEQRFTLVQLCTRLHSLYPMATFHGHCEVAPKACPVYDYKSILKLDSGGRIFASHEAGTGHAKVTDKSSIKGTDWQSEFNNLIAELQAILDERNI